jgi:DNA-3-methyladenine glycosylase
MSGNLRPFDRASFARPAPELAQALLGAVMTRPVDGRLRRARLLEVEAYCGPADLASHSSKGRTRRTEVMFGPPGHAYVYFIYGMHWMFNIVGGDPGAGQAVLVRSGEPLDNWEANLVGPARFARAFGVSGSDNGLDLLGGDIELRTDPQYRPRIVRAKRVGVDYAGRWKDRLLRFIDGASRLSGRVRR